MVVEAEVETNLIIDGQIHSKMNEWKKNSIFGSFFISLQQSRRDGIPY
jgi:hypothetical protein